jgi:cytochrome c peroxidase
MVRWLAMLTLSLAAGLGCERVHRFTPVEITKPPPKEEPRTLRDVAWADTTAQLDVPIVFVPSGDPKWQELPKYWNMTPHPALGSWTLHLGQSPLVAFAVLRASLPVEAVKIRVPLGLPDPTPHIPSSNPPTVGRWQLGKDLFHERMLKMASEILSCADCHRPEHGFTDDWAQKPPFSVNTLSLVNSVYNRRQFWDGRVEQLEEVVAGAPTGGEASEPVHAWSGMFESPKLRQKYADRFLQVFGLTQPTQDAAAKALATYVRTLLQGGSLYDHAEKTRKDRKDAVLGTLHVEAVLDEKTMAVQLDRAGKKKQEVAQEWALGYKLFQEKGQCALCHRGPLFTDQDYHNISISDSFRLELGRIRYAPIGTKEMRLTGAYRTPTLRNLINTSRYFHDGSRRDLREVVTYYSDGIHYNRYLAAALVSSEGRAKAPQLSVEEIDALVVFLRSLEGEPLDEIVAGPPKTKKN